MLTLSRFTAKLSLPVENQPVRFETLEKYNGAGVAPLKVFTLFLCPKSALRSLKRLPFMVGWIVGAVIRYSASQTNFLTHRPKIETFSGGLSLYNGESHHG